MPSSHSSFVTSLSTLVGMEYGFNSTEFAVVAVFSMIIMYDASGVRRAVGKQAVILNQIVDDLQHKKHIEQKKLKEL
ncbi:divergent PAP2 family protein, partial [Clostridium perfringens]